MCTVQCLHISNWTKQIWITFRFYFFFLHVLCIQILSGRECVCHIFNDLNTPQIVTHMPATNVWSCESWLALALPLALTSNAIRFYFSSFNDVFVVDINVFGKRRQSLCFVSHRSNACICANIAIPFHVQPAHVSQQQATREMRWKNFYFILYFFVCFFFLVVVSFHMVLVRIAYKLYGTPVKIRVRRRLPLASCACVSVCQSCAVVPVWGIRWFHKMLSSYFG